MSITHNLKHLATSIFCRDVICRSRFVSTSFKLVVLLILLLHFRSSLDDFFALCTGLLIAIFGRTGPMKNDEGLSVWLGFSCGLVVFNST